MTQLEQPQKGQVTRVHAGSEIKKSASKTSTILLAFILTFLMLPNLSSAQGTEQEDPFYKRLYDEGKDFYENKNFAGAIQDFEIASFGYLDSLPRLVECYVYLTVCHFQQKNYEMSKHYTEEIRRLKLEEHMKAAGLPEDLTKKYEEIVSKLSKMPSK
jgi:hypothetical protein